MVGFYAIDVKNKTANYSAEFHEEYLHFIFNFRVILMMLSLLQFTLSTATFIVYLVNFGPLCLKLKGESGNNESEKIQEPEEPEKPDIDQPEELISL